MAGAGRGKGKHLAMDEEVEVHHQEQRRLTGHGLERRGELAAVLHEMEGLELKPQ